MIASRSSSRATTCSENGLVPVITIIPPKRTSQHSPRVKKPRSPEYITECWAKAAYASENPQGIRIAEKSRAGEGARDRAENNGKNKPTADVAPTMRPLVKIKDDYGGDAEMQQREQADGNCREKKEHTTGGNRDQNGIVRPAHGSV
jgi:hypothetical protein